MELIFLAVLILTMAVALGSGYPVAFALPGAAILSIFLATISGLVFAGDTDAYFHSGGLSQWLTAGVTNLRGIYWEVERDTLIAIPLFIFMGIMLQRSKIAEDLLVAMAQLFGPIPGGLGISVVFVGALLAATTGILGATVVAMGMISLPAMLRNNYSKQLATGTIAASGTLGQIIPPSIVLIILADQLSSATDQASSARKALHKATTGDLSMPSAFDVTSTSAGEMFLGALVPGLVLVGLYMAYILFRAILQPESAPAVPFEQKISPSYFAKLCLTLIAPLSLIFLVLGSIIGGIATVNQAGAIGATGAIIMAGYRLKEGDRNTYTPLIIAVLSLALATYALMNYEMNLKNVQTSEDRIGITLGLISAFMLTVSIFWSGWRTYKISNTLYEVSIETAKTTSLVFVILLGAAMLTAAFRAFGGEDLVRGFLESLPGGFWSKFFMVMLVIFVLGFFLDFIEIAVVVVPIVAPILLADPSANITAVWLGVMIGLNIQTSFLTPPFGFALFYLRGVAPIIVKTIDMYKGVIPFILLQLAALSIVGFYPQLVNYLPNRVSLLAVTAPPPRNPKLQYCLENYVSEVFTTDSDRIISVITEANKLDINYLPLDLAQSYKTALKNAGQTIYLMDDIKKAELETQAASIDYRPIHKVVRAIQSDIRALQALRKLAETRRSQARGDQLVIDTAEAEITKINSDIEALKLDIPNNWEELQSEFSEFIKVEQLARNTYRRTVDGINDTINEVLGTIADGEKYINLEDLLTRLQPSIKVSTNEQAIEIIKNAEATIREVKGTNNLLSLMAKARRELKNDNADILQAELHLKQMIKIYSSNIEWKTKANSRLLEPLQKLQASLSGTIGIRAQAKLTREQALYVAACSSGHRDIGLNF